MPKNSCGVTLIEVLVAFVVLSVTLAVVMQIFSGGLRNARLVDGYSRALLLAESKLAAVGVEKPLVAGEDGGQMGKDFRWRVVINPYGDGGQASINMMRVSLFEVRVQVAWRESTQERTLELTTLRLAAIP